MTTLREKETVEDKTTAEEEKIIEEEKASIFTKLITEWSSILPFLRIKAVPSASRIIMTPEAPRRAPELAANEDEFAIKRFRLAKLIVIQSEFPDVFDTIGK